MNNKQLFFKKISHSIQIISCIIYILLFAFFVCVVPMSIVIFYQEFFDSEEGNVVKLERSGHGGVIIKLDNGEKYLWVITSKPPIVGDKFNKEKYSFKYEVNGKNVMNRAEVIFLLTRMPPLVLFPIIITHILFSIWYYKKFGEVVFATCEGKKYGVIKSYLTMVPIPIILVYYSILYFAIGYWV